jgi:hypothetical protein
MIVMIRTILSFVEDIHKGGSHPAAVRIRTRLRKYRDATVEELSKARE